MSQAPDARRRGRRLISVGERWFVDETCVKVSGVWRCVYRAIDDRGQVSDVLVSKRRDAVAVRGFFTAALRDHGQSGEVVTDRAAALAKAIGELPPDALHNTVRYVNDRVEADHGRLKARLRPMRGLKRDRTANVVIKEPMHDSLVALRGVGDAIEARPRLTPSSTVRPLDDGYLLANSRQSLHPSVAFGMPNVDGISTERWYELVVAGESLSEVVSGCDISVELLRNTCAYEEMSRRLAA